MIYILDIILIINLYIAFRCFKYLFAPPVLLATGMLLAALMATSYYDLWEMKRFLFESLLILGGGPVLFTIFCMFFKRDNNQRHQKNLKQIDVDLVNVTRLEVFYIISIFIGLVGTLLKIRVYMSFFGGGSIPELTMAFRADMHSGDNTFKMPFYISMITRYTITLAYFSSFLLSLLIVFKKKLSFLKMLLIFHILVSLFDGMLSGAKGAMIEVLVRFAIMYIIVLYWHLKSQSLPSSFYYRLLIIGVLFLISFKGLGMLVGRELDERTNFDVLAEYCGAEIKNFDLYMHGMDGNDRTKFSGEECFWPIYRDFNSKYVRYPREFQNINGCHLGNVYTQYFSLHKDFGMPGVIIGSFIMAFLCMLMYNRALKSIRSNILNAMDIFIYATIAISIFMAFFSFRFSEGVITTNFIKILLLLVILQWFLKTFSILDIQYKYISRKINKIEK